MEMIEKARGLLSSRAVRAGVLTASLLAAACSSDKKPDARPLQFDSTATIPAQSDSRASKLPPATLNKCTVKDQAKWQPVPSNINAEGIARALDVPVEAVRAGHFGGVACEQGITIKAIEEKTAKIDVGVGSPCLAIGTAEPPETGKLYTDLLVVCSASEPS